MCSCAWVWLTYKIVLHGLYASIDLKYYSFVLSYMSCYFDFGFPLFFFFVLLLLCLLLSSVYACVIRFSCMRSMRSKRMRDNEVVSLSLWVCVCLRLHWKMYAMLPAVSLISCYRSWDFFFLFFCVLLLVF